MGCCTGRCLLITICILQLVSTIERQVFDFLGYMWIPVIGNFLQIIFVIIGLFGGIQYRPKVVIVYSIWALIWLGWNIFIICFYLEVGILKRDGDILNLGTGNRSWWVGNGIGCPPKGGNVNNITPDPTPPDGDYTEGCLLQYYHVEIIHAGIQCFLSLIGFCVSCFVIYVFTEEDDSSIWETQPVHDELEYIKMRYRSPARSSFRDNNKFYETLTTQMSNVSSLDRGMNFSDESLDRVHQKESSKNSKKSKNYIPSDLQVSVEGQTQLPWTDVSPSPRRRIGSPRSEEGEGFKYNIDRQPPGTTVI